LTWKRISRARRKLEEEEGTIYKDWGGRIPIALAYPNTYHVGMSNLGLHVIYRLFNEQPDIVCERAFYHEDGHPPLSLESQRRIDEFAVLAFTLSFEMDYVKLITMLREAGIPLSFKKRDDSYPLLIAGGPCVMANPEPLAPIFDAFVIGEGEVVVPPLVETLRQGMDARREELLKRLAIIPGVYVPRFYQFERDNDHILGISPSPGLPYPVQRQWLSDLDAHPSTSVIMTEETEFGDMYLMEVARGCHRGCHFCLAGFAYLPMRERSLDILLAQAKEGLKHRQKLGLIGASLSDYSRIEDLATRLRSLGAEISVASLRVDPLPEPLLQALAESGAQTLTVAPEAGSERLRRKIDKGISTRDIIHAAELAARYGFPQLKLYFMIGLPTETDDDVRQIVDLVQAVRKRFSRRLTVNITPFVPKAQTPFQWMAMAPLEVLEERLHYVKQNLRSMNVDLRAESSRWAQVQGILARGDRRLATVLMTIEKKSLSAWKTALEKQGLRAEFYLGSRSRDEILPWAAISTGIGVERPKQGLAKEATS
jgi:radical SAM superfamily enzyme YgiQ (UPF0313 family)